MISVHWGPNGQRSAHPFHHVLQPPDLNAGPANTRAVKRHACDWAAERGVPESAEQAAAKTAAASCTTLESPDTGISLCPKPMQRVSSSLKTTRSCDQSVYEHDPARDPARDRASDPARDRASDPASDPSSDSVSDSANLQTCISVILESYRATQPWRYQLPGAGECEAHHARGEQGAVSSVVLLLVLWWVRLPAASGIRVPHTDQRWHLLPDTGSLDHAAQPRIQTTVSRRHTS